MNELIREVTPLTRAIVWLRSLEINQSDTYYSEIDYLLDGLLTASRRNPHQNSFLLVGKSFSKNLFVFVSPAKPSRIELESFLALLSKELSVSEKILLIDEIQGREEFMKYFPDKILPHLSFFK